jgi:hypothetical protein
MSTDSEIKLQACRFFPVLPEKKTYPINFEKNFSILVKKGEAEGVSRLVFLLDESRTQLEEILPALWAGERKYFAKENMEPNVSVRTYISLLNGLAALEITDSAEEKREKVQAEKEAEAKTTKQNDEDEKKDEKTNEADTKEADAKEEQKKTTTTDNMDSKAGFLRTPSTMLGFRWKDLASSQDNIYRHVSLHHERAAVMMALGICVSNIAVTESKAVTVDGVTDAAKTALCAAGLFKAAEEAVSAETVILPTFSQHLYLFDVGCCESFRRYERRHLSASFEDLQPGDRPRESSPTVHSARPRSWVDCFSLR